MHAKCKLNLRLRKSLYFHTLLGSQLRDVRNEILSDPEHGAELWNAAAEQLERRTTSIYLSRNSQPLDEAVVDSLNTVVNATSGMRHCTKLSVVHDAVQQAIAASGSCAACVNGAACDGTEDDRLRMASPDAWCWERFRRLFDLALHIAHEAYSRLGQVRRAPGVELQLEYMSGSPPSFAPWLAFTAKTDKRAAMQSTVRLQCDPKRLAKHGDFCVLYFLLHEIVCHAYNGALTPNQPRLEAPEDNPFEDGWMDEVAHLLLQTSAQSVAAQFADVHDAIDEGGQLHDLRALPVGDRGAPARAIGATAARWLQRLLGHGSLEQFLTLSLLLNGSSVPNGWNERFACAVYRLARRSKRNPEVIFIVRTLLGSDLRTWPEKLVDYAGK